MKQIIFTMLLIACFAISQNAFGIGALITGNCPQMYEEENCLITNTGIVRVGITVKFSEVKNKNTPGLEDTNWSVAFAPSDPSQYTILPKSDFAYWGNGTYVYSNHPYPYHTFTVDLNIQMHTFAMYLMAENNAYVIDSTGPPGGQFQICQGDNRLSSPSLTGTKINSQIGIENLEDPKEDFKVYPNPVESDFTIEYQGNKNENITFEIFDVEGRSIYKTEFLSQDSNLQSNKIENLGLEKGIYFYNIRSNNSYKTLKISKL